MTAFKPVSYTHLDVYKRQMVDGEFVDGLKDNKLLWRGSTNQKVIDVQKSLEIDKVVLAVK